MATLRFQALEKLFDRSVVDVKHPDAKVSAYFGENVFSLDTMQEYLPKAAFKQIQSAIVKGVSIDRDIADQVATAMKAWALSKGVTHYTHWFQPLTGRTAEKHDAFFTPSPDGKGSIEKFESGQLVQQEPDASSFPNGGLRNTFEARGYTAWDPSSPAFIYEKTLCIPTVFVSYYGEALDNKAPLIKSVTALDEAATAVYQYFDRNAKRVVPTLGWEQEYFLVDAALYQARPDLQQTGRTLFGHSSSKGQQMDDHYFGNISDRAVAFMKDFETESWKLGIPVTTRHNEVAPNQFECAPVYEEMNIAVDHNVLLMDVMEKVAMRHNFRVLLHEKPFKGLNGSGKHNNWSLASDTGVNLLQPGTNPKSNLRFLTFLVNSIMAVSKHSDLLRATIASAGNDHRLGANEAPPAIISVFIGSHLTQILDEIEERVGEGKMNPNEKTELKLKIGKIPNILQDNTDRNRTSPFAFTGNKFEYRAVGSTANCAEPMTALNAIMAQQLMQFKMDVDALIKKGTKKDDAILKVLRKYIIASKKTRFEGNGYGDEWVQEALKRGLSNNKDTPAALKSYKSKEVKELYTSLGIFTEDELDARYEIQQEKYRMIIQIESRVIEDMVLNLILPASESYMGKLIANASGLKELYGKDYQKMAATTLETIQELSERMARIKKDVESMRQERKKANTLSDAESQAVAYSKNVLTYFEGIRYEVDKIERVLDNEIWPLPKYREMLFTK